MTPRPRVSTRENLSTALAVLVIRPLITIATCTISSACRCRTMSSLFSFPRALLATSHVMIYMLLLPIFARRSSFNINARPRITVQGRSGVVSRGKRAPKVGGNRQAPNIPCRILVPTKRKVFNLVSLLYLFSTTPPYQIE